MNSSSIIIDKVNSFLANMQEKMRPIVSSSLFLQRFDYLIMLLTLVLLASSLFISTNLIGILGLLIFLLTIFKLFIVRGQKIEVNTSILLLIGYMAVCAISIFFSDYFLLSVKGFIKTFIYLSFYFSMVQLFRFNKNKIIQIISILAIIVTFEALWAIGQALNPADIVSSWQDTSYVNPEDTLSRIFGTLKNPNLLCAYLIVGLANINTIAFMAFIGKHKKTFTVAVSSLIVTLIAIFLTGCRGGYVGVFAMFIVAFFLINYILKNYFSEKVKKAWKKICTCFVAMAGMAIVFSPAILKRLLSIFILRGDSSTSFRMNVYQSSWQMFIDNWFSGVGVGNETFINAYSLYMKTGYLALSTYSVYLEIAVESGIFALIFFISYFVSLIKSAVKSLKENFSVEQKAVIISILIMLAGVFVHGFFDTVFFRPQVQFLFWINIAILTVLTENNERVSNFIPIMEKVFDFTKDNFKKIYNGVKDKWKK